MEFHALMSFLLSIPFKQSFYKFRKEFCKTSKGSYGPGIEDHWANDLGVRRIRTRYTFKHTSIPPIEASTESLLPAMLAVSKRDISAIRTDNNAGPVPKKSPKLRALVAGPRANPALFAASIEKLIRAFSNEFRTFQLDLNEKDVAHTHLKSRTKYLRVRQNKEAYEELTRWQGSRNMQRQCRQEAWKHQGPQKVRRYPRYYSLQIRRRTWLQPWRMTCPRK